MNWTLLAFQLLNLGLLLTWFVLTFLAIRDLKRHRMPSHEYILWALVALFVPWIGASLCLLVVNKYYPLEQA